MYKSRDTPHVFCLHQHFFQQKLVIFVMSENINIILLTFIESLYVILMNMIVMLMMPAKFATPGLLKEI